MRIDPGSGAEEVRQRLQRPSLPPEVVTSLLNEVPEWWLGRERAEAVAEDLSMCYPLPSAGELRGAAVAALDPTFCRMTLVGRNELDLVPALAVVAASRLLLVERSAAVAWHSGELMMVRATLRDPSGATAEDRAWRQVLADVRRAATADRLPRVPAAPAQRVMVERRSTSSETIVVTAAHQAGLLWAICSWFQARGRRIAAAQTESVGDVRRSIFTLDGPIDLERLGEDLRGADRTPGRLVRRLAGHFLAR